MLVWLPTLYLSFIIKSSDKCWPILIKFGQGVEVWKILFPGNLCQRKRDPWKDSPLSGCFWDPTASISVIRGVGVGIEIVEGSWKVLWVGTGLYRLSPHLLGLTILHLPLWTSTGSNNQEIYNKLKRYQMVNVLYFGYTVSGVELNLQIVYMPLYM